MCNCNVYGFSNVGYNLSFNISCLLLFGSFKFMFSELSREEQDVRENVTCTINMKAKFSNDLKRILETKNVNTRLLSLSKYNDLLAKIIRIKESGPCETRDYRIIRRFDVVQLGLESRIITRKYKRILLYAEEVYDIIEEVHIVTGHGGRDQILNRLKLVYENITRELVMLFIENCDRCKQRKKKK